ncbi:acyl carrier protein [Streptomyces sp. TRM66268-LWL]|uniref:Acyl carrier protein n=1 Tax=Streptomyces polyasparticus TaxID=2767826 RepID=A0ABR7SCR5_9ACTN|nr:acyl carrier protein [Streptomyces polyasparticus]MBC9712954.1 acyl carrier protein [Streptomyces polyasparticus]
MTEQIHESSGTTSHDFLTEQIRALCAEVLTVDVERITPGTRLIGDLEADSLDFAELADRLATQYGIAGIEDTLRAAETVGDVVELVRGAPQLPDIPAQRDASAGT